MGVGIKTSVLRGTWELLSGLLCLGVHELVRISVLRGAWELVSGPP